MVPTDQESKGLLDSLTDRLKKLVSSDKSNELLKDEILALNELCREFIEVLDKEGLGGFPHATVIRSGDTKMKLYRNPEFGDFKLNSTVAISKASVFARLPTTPDGVGRIVEFDPADSKGWARVEFEGGKQMVVRYGNPSVDEGVSDLILLGDKLTKDSERPTITVSMRGELFEVINLFKFECKEGDTVLLNPTNHYLVSVIEPISKGIVATIDEVVDAGFLVSINGTKRLVSRPKETGSWKPEKGDRILVDDTQSVVIMNLPRPQSIAIASDIRPVKWDDVIGLHTAKKELMRVIHELTHKELFDAYDADAAKGALLWGPPGNGKTHIAKAVATLLRETLGSEGDMVRGFMYIKGTEILDMYVGEGPRKVREIFARAEEYYRLTGQKCIIVVDEVESVLKRRGNSHDSGSSDSITNAFLTELDGIQQSYAFFLGATNRIDLIDPAALRGGRLDRKIYVGRPEVADVPAFFKLQFRDVRLSKEITLEQAIDHATKQYLSPDYAFFDLYFAKEGIDPKDESIKLEERLRHETFNLSHIGSGAMIMTIINNAKAKAIERDIAAGVKGDAVSGLKLEDITMATAEMYHEYRRIKHDDEIQEFLKGQKADPVDYKERA